MLRAADEALGSGVRQATMSTCGGSRPGVPRCVLSLYYVQKFLFELNRSEEIQTSYWADGRAVLDSYTLTTEEEDALIEPDIGLLFHLGVNGQILMHFAALHQIEWQDYLQRMRDGIETHGPVREGVYAVTGYEGTHDPGRGTGISAGSAEEGGSGAELAGRPCRGPGISAGSAEE